MRFAHHRCAPIVCGGVVATGARAKGIYQVDHADITAEVLAPILESNTVNVRAYRKLRRGNKTGLLLEAA